MLTFFGCFFIGIRIIVVFTKSVGRSVVLYISLTSLNSSFNEFSPVYYQSFYCILSISADFFILGLLVLCLILLLIPYTHNHVQFRSLYSNSWPVNFPLCTMPFSILSIFLKYFPVREWFVPSLFYITPILGFVTLDFFVIKFLKVLYHCCCSPIISTNPCCSHIFRQYEFCSYHWFCCCIHSSSF